MFALIGGKIATWFLSGGLAAIGKIGVDLYSKRIEGQNNTERVVAELAARELDCVAREREVDGKLLIVEQGNWMTRWVRPAWAAPFVAFSWKIVVYDKVLGLGTTDPLDPNMWTLMMVVAGSYYGGRSLETVARIWQTRAGVTGTK